MRRANEAAYRGYWPATASHQLSTVTVGPTSLSAAPCAKMEAGSCNFQKKTAANFGKKDYGCSKF